MNPDTTTVYLRNSSSPFAIADSSKAYMSPYGTGTFTFSNAINGVNYYLQVKHRNSIETWSDSARSFVSSTLTYDFTTSVSSAFGNNITLKGTKYCIYSGDVNQDGAVDLTDGAAIDNDGYNYVKGYVNTDLTGDNFVDISDAAIVEDNGYNFVTVVRP